MLNDSLINLETLVENLDIAKHIMQFLDYDDHLSMSRVCRHFEYIVVNFIWKWQYRQVEIFMKPGINLISNHMNAVVQQPVNHHQLGENWKFLNTNEFEEFLRLNSSNIEHLEVWSRLSFNEDNYLKFCLTNELSKLTSLHLYGVVLANFELKRISEYCPILDTLVLEDCVNARKQILIVGHDIKLESIRRHLKSFTVKSNCIYKNDMHVYNYRHIQEILRYLKTEKLYINVAIYSDNDGHKCKDYISDNVDNNAYIFQKVINQDQYIDAKSPCQELQIEQFHMNEDFLKFLKICENQFENIIKLTIGGYMFSPSVTIDSYFYNVLSRCCPKLKVLKLSGCILNDSVTLPNLEDLTLEACTGLDCVHLKQILGETQLKSFKTYQTEYSGNINHFALSHSLQYLELDLRNEGFVRLFDQMLPNLISIKCSSYADYKFRNIAHNFPKLQIINTTESHLDNVENLLNLTRLHTITLRKCHNICGFFRLLQHPSIRYLKLEIDNDKLQKMPTNNYCSKLLERVRTKHLNLEIPLNLFKVLLEFWFQLISANSQLLLTVTIPFVRDLDKEFMYSLIYNTNFPSRIKSFTVCGLNIGKCILQ